jgi:hypothetical protein
LGLFLNKRLGCRTVRGTSRAIRGPPGPFRAQADSIDAGIEIETDQAALGYYTSCVMVWDTDLVNAKKKAETVRNIINNAGFTCKQETFNNLDAWKSMIPGQGMSETSVTLFMCYLLTALY